MNALCCAAIICCDTVNNKIFCVDEIKVLCFYPTGDGALYVSRAVWIRHGGFPQRLQRHDRQNGCVQVKSHINTGLLASV